MRTFDGIVQVVGLDSFVSITNDPMEFASAIIRIVGDDDKWLKVSSHAYSAKLENYNFESAVASLAGRYTAGLERSP